MVTRNLTECEQCGDGFRSLIEKCDDGKLDTPEDSGCI